MDQRRPHVMVVYGTRPEAVKMAPLIRILRDDQRTRLSTVVTGQHRRMLDQVNGLFGTVPDFDLDVMRHGASLNELATRVMTELDPVLSSCRPDMIVVQGDTTTAFMAGLAGFNRQIPVAHLEAGLRTHDLRLPFPEEANRQMLSRISSINFSPTPTAKHNLLDEGIDAGTILVTGNTVIDALAAALEIPATYSDDSVAETVSSDTTFVLVTMHRRESWGEPMRAAMMGIRDAAHRHPEVDWVVPMHANPVVRQTISGVMEGLQNVILTESLDYHEFSHALAAARFCVTDSGGVQEEGPSVGTPVLVLRDNTERPEGVAAGTVRLIGTKTNTVSQECTRLINDEKAYAKMRGAPNPYGDGFAAQRCRDAILHHFGRTEVASEFTPDVESGRAD